VGATAVQAAVDFREVGTWTRLVYSPINSSARCPGAIQPIGVLGAANNYPATSSIKLYRPGQRSLTVYPSKTLFAGHVGRKVNNSSDFVYNVNSVPYLHRHSESRSYRLDDLADSYTKTLLFASSAGDVRNSPHGIGNAVVADDNLAGTGDAFAGRFCLAALYREAVTFHSQARRASRRTLGRQSQSPANAEGVSQSRAAHGSSSSFPVKLLRGMVACWRTFPRVAAVRGAPWVDGQKIMCEPRRGSTNVCKPLGLARLERDDDPGWRVAAALLR
jgi:hypothetical protein